MPRQSLTSSPVAFGSPGPCERPRARVLMSLVSGYRCSLASPPGRLAIEKEMMAVAPLAEAIKRASAVQGRGWDRAGLRPKPAATRSRAYDQQGMTSSREMAVLLQATPSTARIDLVIRCRSRMFFASTCVRMLTSPGSGAHRDDFWQSQEARQDGG